MYFKAFWKYFDAFEGIFVCAHKRSRVCTLEIRCVHTRDLLCAHRRSLVCTQSHVCTQDIVLCYSSVERRNYRRCCAQTAAVH